MAKGTQVSLKGVYGKPLSKAAGSDIPLTREQLRRMGDIILEEIKKEIKKDMAKSRGLSGPGKPAALPQTQRFPESFKVRLKGASTLDFYSDWPTAKAHTTEVKEKDLLNPQDPKATKPYPMKWLIRSKTPRVRINRPGGESVVRFTPDLRQGQKVWIHPGYRRYTFLQRGIRKGRDKAIAVLTGEIVEKVLGEYDLVGE